MTLIIGLGVVLFNFDNEDFTVNMGDRIAQLIFEKIKTPVIKEIDSLEGSRRESQGYGSTGVGAIQSSSDQDFRNSSSNAESVIVQDVKSVTSSVFL